MVSPDRLPDVPDQLRRRPGAGCLRPCQETPLVRAAAHAGSSDRRRCRRRIQSPRSGEIRQRRAVRAMALTTPRPRRHRSAERRRQSARHRHRRIRDGRGPLRNTARRSFNGSRRGRRHRAKAGAVSTNAESPSVPASSSPCERTKPEHRVSVPPGRGAEPPAVRSVRRGDRSPRDSGRSVH